MDEFVRNQLTLIGCEDLISLFRDEGFNEEAYRKLTNRKLMHLLPEDDDGSLAFKIMCNVTCINNPDSASTSGLFPPPNVVIKTEPLEETDQLVQPAAPTPQNDDDEVQIVSQIIRAPSDFIRVEIKQEIPEQVNGDDAHQPSSSTSTIINDSNHNASGSSVTESTLAEGAGNGGIANSMNGAHGHDNESSDNGGIIARRTRGSSKRRGEPMTVDPKVKQCKAVEVEGSWRKFIELTFGQTSSRLTRTQLAKRFGDKLEFTLSTTTQLKDVLRSIEAFSDRLHQFVKKLKFTISPTDDTVSITSQHLHQLANLPEAFLNQLTNLTFNVQFPESTDFHQITTLLSRCPNLTKFKVQRGTVLTGNKAVSLHVPKMEKLVSFNYAGMIYLSVPDYDQPPSPIDVETDTDTFASKTNLFQVDFGNLTFPALEKLYVGPFIELEFETLSQFPKMKTLDTGHVSSIKPLRWFSTESTCNSVNWVDLFGVARIELIQLIPRAFPNMTKLSLTFPGISTLRSVIVKLGDMTIKYFSATVNFEFEAAFFAAFCGHSFKLVTEHDKLKFAKLQKYEHWEGFMKHLGIEVPEEESSNSPTSLGDEESNHNDHATVANDKISSFKFLKTFKLRHMPARIYLPENDLHWNNPDVKLSSNRWSSIKQKFPGAILLKELSKLKGQLEYVNLDDFEVDQDTIHQFEEIVGFKLDFDPWQAIGGDLDTFARTDSIEEPSSQEIKQEK